MQLWEVFISVQSGFQFQNFGVKVQQIWISNQIVPHVEIFRYLLRHDSLLLQKSLKCNYFARGGKLFTISNSLERLQNVQTQHSNQDLTEFSNSNSYIQLVVNIVFIGIYLFRDVWKRVIKSSQFCDNRVDVLYSQYVHKSSQGYELFQQNQLVQYYITATLFQLYIQFDLMIWLFILVHIKLYKFDLCKLSSGLQISTSHF